MRNLEPPRPPTYSLTFAFDRALTLDDRTNLSPLAPMHWLYKLYQEWYIQRAAAVRIREYTRHATYHIRGIAADNRTPFLLTTRTAVTRYQVPKTGKLIQAEFHVGGWVCSTLQ